MHLGFFAPDDPRASRHVDAIRASLSVDGGLLRRYTVQDDFGHMEAAFTVCTFWLVEALALIGRTDEARELFDRLLSLDNGLGLYSEDILPDTLEQSGNFPQTYSHVGLINAAFRLSRRWDWGRGWEGMERWFSVGAGVGRGVCVGDGIGVVVSGVLVAFRRDGWGVGWGWGGGGGGLAGRRGDLVGMIGHRLRRPEATLGLWLASGGGARVNS